MKLPLSFALPIALAACTAGTVARNSGFSSPATPEIARSFALRDRYQVPKPIGRPAIFVDSVAVHHMRAEASTIVWKDEAGNWQWSQVSETGPGGLLAVERKLASNDSRQLTVTEAETLEGLIADSRLYREKLQTDGAMGIGAPFHVMSIVTPFGRKTISWNGRLQGISGAIADIVLSTN